MYIANDQGIMLLFSPSATARRHAFLAIAGLFGALLLVALTATSAHAVAGPFCPSSSTRTETLGPSPDRCIWFYHNDHRKVTFNNINYNVIKCAIVKPNSDGSGGNVGGQAECIDSSGIPTVRFTSLGANGYATGTTREMTVTRNGFQGYLELY